MSDKRINIDDWAKQGDLIPVDTNDLPDDDGSLTTDGICDVCQNSGLEDADNDVFFCDCAIGQAFDTLTGHDIDVDSFVDQGFDLLSDDEEEELFNGIDLTQELLDDIADHNAQQRDALENWGWLPWGGSDIDSIEVDFNTNDDTCN